MKKYLRKFHTWLGKFLEEPASKGSNSTNLTESCLKELIEAGYRVHKTLSNGYTWKFASVNFYSTWEAKESFNTEVAAWEDAWRDWTS